jgi:hypothetical protein
MQGLGLQALAPNPDENSLDDWWENVTSRVDGPIKKGLNSVIILVAWSLWNHLNRCVFDGALPNLDGVLSSIREELDFWDSLELEELTTSSPSSRRVSLVSTGLGVLSLYQGY